MSENVPFKFCFYLRSVSANPYTFIDHLEGVIVYVTIYSNTYSRESYIP